MEPNNTITVTGCGDCPMSYTNEKGTNYCQLSLNEGHYFATCPLKTNSLTIQLKQDGTI